MVCHDVLRKPLNVFFYTPVDRKGVSKAYTHTYAYSAHTTHTHTHILPDENIKRQRRRRNKNNPMIAITATEPFAEMAMTTKAKRTQGMSATT